MLLWCFTRAPPKQTEIFIGYSALELLGSSANGDWIEIEQALKLQPNLIAKKKSKKRCSSSIYVLKNIYRSIFWWMDISDRPKYLPGWHFRSGNHSVSNITLVWDISVSTTWTLTRAWSLIQIHNEIQFVFTVCGCKIPGHTAFTGFSCCLFLVIHFMWKLALCSVFLVVKLMWKYSCYSVWPFGPKYAVSYNSIHNGRLGGTYGVLIKTAFEADNHSYPDSVNG